MAINDLYHKINIEEIINSIQNSPRQKNRGRSVAVETDKIILSEGAASKLITKFEEKNKILLPQDYKTFLSFSNGAGIFGLDLLPIGEVYKIGFNYLDALDRDRSLKHLYVIAEQGDGNYNPINLQMPRGAKNPNRRDILDVFHEDDETMVIAKSFGEFIYRIIEGSKIQDKTITGADLRERGFKASDDETFNQSFYWLQEGFEPYREYSGVEIEK